MDKKRLLLILAVCCLSIGLLAWLFIESSKPLPGEVVLQDSRNHIPEGSQTDYKFNPPTSGDHYPSWITKGFYDTPRPDGNLVHSQEHGYIIIWYDCEKKLSAFSLQPTEVYAQEPTKTATTSAEDATQSIQMTSGSEGSSSATLAQMPKSFSDGSCDNLKNKLKDIYNTLGPHKMVVTPRIGMGYPIILTAWGRMEKLTSIDEGKIKEFINAFRDQGPEATVEP